MTTFFDIFENVNRYCKEVSNNIVKNNLYFENKTKLKEYLINRFENNISIINEFLLNNKIDFEEEYYIACILKYVKGNFKIENNVELLGLFVYAIKEFCLDEQILRMINNKYMLIQLEEGEQKWMELV